MVQGKSSKEKWNWKWDVPYDVLLQYNGPLHGTKGGNIKKHSMYYVTQDIMKYFCKVYKVFLSCIIASNQHRVQEDTMVRYYGSNFLSFIQPPTSYVGQHLPKVFFMWEK
jgi:hypothetical protein